MRVAAYQAPLLPPGSMDAIEHIRKRVAWCEAQGVDFLCCPEAVLGGLADYAPHPKDIALDVESGELNAVLAPLGSDTVTTILGFTEVACAGELYNSAVVFHKRAIAGVYRKLHPAIAASVYRPGDRIPVFHVSGLTFGIIICNDFNYREPAQSVAAQGATVLFVPTNNGLPPAKADVGGHSRGVDVARAVENAVLVVRADVAGRTGELVSYGSSGIVDSDGTILQAARRFTEEVLVAEVDGPSRKFGRVCGSSNADPLGRNRLQRNA